MELFERCRGYVCVPISQFIWRAVDIYSEELSSWYSRGISTTLLNCVGGVSPKTRSRVLQITIAYCLRANEWVLLSISSTRIVVLCVLLFMRSLMRRKLYLDYFYLKVDDECCWWRCSEEKESEWGKKKEIVFFFQVPECGWSSTWNIATAAKCWCSLTFNLYYKRRGQLWEYILQLLGPSSTTLRNTKTLWMNPTAASQKAIVGDSLRGKTK